MAVDQRRLERLYALVSQSFLGVSHHDGKIWVSGFEGVEQTLLSVVETSVSLATGMGPPDCHDLGATSAER